MSMQVDPFALVPHQVIQHWEYSLAMGMGLIALAVVAWLRSFRSMNDSVYFFGGLFITASAIESLGAYLTGGWSGFYLHLFSAVLFGVTGFMLLTYAKTSTEIATLIVAMYLITAGIFNVIAPMAANVPDRGWHVLAGFITLILGPLLLGYRTRERVQMPVFRVIGIFIGIDLFFRGLAFNFLASDLRSH